MLTRGSWLCSCSLVALLSGLYRAAFAADTTGPEVITCISQTADLLKSNVSQVVPARLSGAVYGVDQTHRGLALKDDTGLLWLETERLPAGLEAGVRVKLEGPLTLGAGRAILGNTILIEGKASQGPGDWVGRVHLQAGKRPFKLDYYQATREQTMLKMDWMGPDFSLGRLPCSALWHTAPNAPGRFLPGIQYEFYEYQSAGDWDGFPDFTTMAPSESGISSNFIPRLSLQRTNCVAMRFTGALDIRKAGDYEFRLRAVDGARMSLPFDSPGRIEVAGPADLDPPWRLDPGQEWGDLAEPSWVCVEGTVRQIGFDDGRLQMELVAETGRIQATVAEGELSACARLLNSHVRVAGLAWGADTQSGRRVAGTILVPSMAQIEVQPVQGSPRLLTSIEQIRRLTIADAARHYPVRFTGIVTFVFYGGSKVHVQGETEGLCVAFARTNTPMLHAGDFCEFQGVTEKGAMSPTSVSERCTILGRGEWPEPLRPTWRQLSNGDLDSQWVEIQGVVLGAKSLNLILGMHGGEMTARVYRGDPSQLKGLLNAVVRVRGSVTLASSKKRRVENISVEVNSPKDITVDTAPPKDLFDIPAQPMADLRLFDPSAAPVRFIKITGQIVHAERAGFYVSDGTNGLRVTPRQRVTLLPGDLVEAVGIPENDGILPTLRQASVKTDGHSALFPARPLPADETASIPYDSTLVQVEGTIVSLSATATNLFMELAAERRNLVLKLNRPPEKGSKPPLRSRVRVTGVYLSPTLTGVTKTSLSAPEIILNSPGDLDVLSRPSWWTLRHSLLVVGAMSLVLAGALAWVTSLRRRVALKTLELREEIAQHRRTETHLNKQTKRLLGEIEERKRAQLEVDRIHRELVDASRQAGQAEVAASVLHNVGNVLNSVNVSASIITERVRQMRLAHVSKAGELLQKRAADLARFLSEDENGRRLPGYLVQLGGQLSKQQQGLLEELKGLGQNIEHIKEIVAMQQAYAKRGGVVENADVPELIESVFKMQAAACQSHAIDLIRDYEPVSAVQVDKHKLLQILVNLFENAKHACVEGGQAPKKITARIRRSGASGILIEVADNGIGIPPENLPRLFRHGFTTRKDGHGFGLHSGALAAKELGGKLVARSDGVGKGATFAIELPLRPPGAPSSARA
jgi:signal transduction histidine kinase